MAPLTKAGPNGPIGKAVTGIEPVTAFLVPYEPEMSAQITDCAVVGWRLQGRTVPPIFRRRPEPVTRKSAPPVAAAGGRLRDP